MNPVPSSPDRPRPAWQALAAPIGGRSCHTPGEQAERPLGRRPGGHGLQRAPWRDAMETEALYVASTATGSAAVAKVSITFGFAPSR
ncbi:hypothetical protein [Streptomyces decoyicus]|uniref:hypothetical protein n=1 Tax=Streptomyces decoyicus TaxID=249567 RepID=UPI00364F8675